METKTSWNIILLPFISLLLMTFLGYCITTSRVSYALNFLIGYTEIILYFIFVVLISYGTIYFKSPKSKNELANKILLFGLFFSPLVFPVLLFNNVLYIVSTYFIFIMIFFYAWNDYEYKINFTIILSCLILFQIFILGILIATLIHEELHLNDYLVYNIHIPRIFILSISIPIIFIVSLLLYGIGEVSLRIKSLFAENPGWKTYPDINETANVIMQIYALMNVIWVFLANIVIGIEYVFISIGKVFFEIIKSISRELKKLNRFKKRFEYAYQLLLSVFVLQFVFSNLSRKIISYLSGTRESIYLIVFYSCIILCTAIFTKKVLIEFITHPSMDVKKPKIWKHSFQSVVLPTSVILILFWASGILLTLAYHLMPSVMLKNYAAWENYITIVLTIIIVALLLGKRFAVKYGNDESLKNYPHFNRLNKFSYNQLKRVSWIFILFILLIIGLIFPASKAEKINNMTEVLSAQTNTSITPSTIDTSNVGYVDTISTTEKQKNEDSSNENIVEIDSQPVVDQEVKQEIHEVNTDIPEQSHQTVIEPQSFVVDQDTEESELEPTNISSDHSKVNTNTSDKNDSLLRFEENKGRLIFWTRNMFLYWTIYLDNKEIGKLRYWVNDPPTCDSRNVLGIDIAEGEYSYNVYETNKKGDRLLNSSNNKYNKIIVVKKGKCTRVRIRDKHGE